MSVVVASIIQVLVLLLQVDAALAAYLTDLAVCSTNVGDPKDDESDRNRNQEIVSDGFEVQARLFVSIKC